ncbi:MAG: GNAT family N-acyltransferase, partial [Myxococcota bacterium]
MKVVARPPRTPGELRALLALRGRVFGASWMAGHCQIVDGLERDDWDVAAHHLGVWNGEADPIGVARVLTADPVPTSARQLEALGLPTTPPQARVPALDDFYGEGATPFLDDRRVLEISRFGIAADARGQRMGAFLAWAVCAWALVHGGVRPIVFRVPVDDVPVYRRLVGALPVSTTTREHYRRRVRLLEVRATRLAPEHRAIIEQYATRLDAG